MQKEIKDLKKKLPARGAYPGILEANKQLNKTLKTPVITLDQLKKFFTGKEVADDAFEPIIISTKKYLEQLKEKESSRKKLMAA